jgi:hypothetical protein
MQSPQCQWVEKYQLEIEELSTLVKWNHTVCYLIFFSLSPEICSVPVINLDPEEK